jgi:virginiamycin B lyase
MCETSGSNDSPRSNHRDLDPGATHMRQPCAAAFLFLLLTGAGIAKVAVPPGPGWLGVGFGSVWLSKSESAAVLRIDPASNSVVATIPVGPDPELGIGIGLGSVWVADTRERSLRRIDPATNKVVRTYPVNISEEPEGSIGVGAGSVWLLTNENGTDSGTLSRLDPATGKIIANIRVKPKSYGVVVADHSVWVSNWADASVMRIDARTNKVVADLPVHASPRFLAVGAGSIWVLSQGDGTLARIDPASNRVTATIEVGVPGPGGDLWVADGFVWVSGEGVPISIIDPRTNKLIKQYAGGEKDDTLRVGFGAVWVVEELSGYIWKVSVSKLKHAP